MRSVRTLALDTLAVAAALSLSACAASLGPKYQHPEIPVPAAYSQPGTAAAVVPDAWWKLFGDPALDRLEDEALAANQDLAAAAARIEEARALLGLTRAESFPEVSAGVSGSRTKFSAKTAQLPPGVPLESSDLRATASVSYDFDFWGRYARATEAARAELVASEEGRRNIAVTLTADVANAWLDLLSYRRQLALAKDTVGSRQEAVRLQQVRYDAGTISELDLAQAQAELASIEATVPTLERQARQAEDRLGVLLGRIGGTVAAGNLGLDAVQLPAVPVGLPSDLLARRPDVAAAEQGLIAAHARIAQARAAYFPTFSLTGYAGGESRELAGLFSSGAGIWQAALNLVQPIWNGGRTRRQVEAAEAREKQALAAYAKALQSAFADVEDALVARTTSVTAREAFARQVEALERARNLARLRYDAGSSSYLEVLDAERNLFRAQLDLAQARRGELGAAVTLFKALGGGWEEKPVETPAR